MLIFFLYGQNISYLIYYCCLPTLTLCGCCVLQLTYLFSFCSYESEFFLNVVHGRDIVSWGAVDQNRSDGHSDQLIGFVTARLVMAKGSEVSP